MRADPPQFRRFRESSPPSRLAVFEPGGVALEGTAAGILLLPLKPGEVGHIGTGLCAIKVREFDRSILRKSENGADLRRGILILCDIGAPITSSE